MQPEITYFVNMPLKKLINKSVPGLSPEDDCQKAAAVMNDFKVSHLAVVAPESRLYLGLASEERLKNEPPEKKIAELGSLPMLCIGAGGHLFEVLDIVSSRRISLLPVVDGDGKYLGAVTYRDIVENTAEAVSASDKGGILEIETDAQNFSPATITGISENNSMKVMSLLSGKNSGEKVRAIIKLNGQDTSGVIQGLERRGYRVKNPHSGAAKYTDLLEERYGALMSYMNV